MAKTKVVLCDDDGTRVRTWKAQIEAVPGLEAEVDVRALTPKEFADAYAALERRQLASRRGGDIELEDAAVVLDSADVVVVDFDLTPRQPQELGDDSLDQLVGSFGDVFAYLTRCYTLAGYTVLVNQTYFEPTFDLTMSEFDYSFADLNITDSDLGRPSLWFGTADSVQFRPWHWPRLLDAALYVHRLEALINLEDKLFDGLGLALDDILNAFDSKQLEPLGVGTSLDKLRDLTFASLASADCHFGRRSRSEALSKIQEQRLAAAALMHWLERIVIPAQNVLVDLPHLAERRPHLVRDERWTDLPDHAPEDLSGVLDVEALSGAAVSAQGWFRRPVWVWSLCPPADVDSIDAAEVVFCEDVSWFLTPDAALEFRSSVAGPWSQRFVSRAFADQEENSVGADATVDYRPETRLYE